MIDLLRNRTIYQNLYANLANNIEKKNLKFRFMEITEGKLL